MPEAISISAQPIRAHRRYLLALVIVCLGAVGAGLVTQLHRRCIRTYDAGNYAEVAANILAGRGFSSSVVSNFYRCYPQVHHPEDRRPSSWSLVLAMSFWLAGKSAFAIVLPNLLLGLLAGPVLVYFLGRAWRLPPAAAFAAAILFLCWPYWLKATTGGEADVLFTDLTLLILLLIVVSQRRLGWVLLAGGLLGLAYTVKPAALFLIAPLGLYYWLGSGSWPTYRRALMLGGAALIALVVASPLLMRNYHTLGNPIYTTNVHTAGQMGFDESGRELMGVYWNQPRPSLAQTVRSRGLSVLGRKVGNQIVRAARDLFAGLGLIFLMPSLLVLIGRWGTRWLRLGWLAVAVWVVELAIFWAIRPRLLLPFVAVLTLSAAAGGLALDERRTRKPGTGLIVFLTIVILVAGMGIGGYWLWHHHQQADRLVMASYVTAATWIKDNLPADTIVMSHRPYLVRFYSDHPVVQIPFDSSEKMEQVISHYGVSAVVVQQSSLLQQWARELPREQLTEIIRQRRWRLAFGDRQMQVYTAASQ